MHRKCACRSLNDSFPCILACERVNQPSGSASSPGIDIFLRYAARHREEKESGTDSGTYMISTLSLNKRLKWMFKNSHSGPVNTHFESARNMP